MKHSVQDVMINPRPDRRLLSHVPDPDRIRTTTDRRSDDLAEDRPEYARYAGKRYLAVFPVKVTGRYSGKVSARCIDISQTGMLLRLTDGAIDPRDDDLKLKFQLLPGTLHEGMEKRVRIHGKCVRRAGANEVGIEFREPLYQYVRRTKDNLLLSLASMFLFLVTLFIILLRVQSVTEFRSNVPLYLYSIITAAFLLTRYLFGALYKPVPVNPDFCPSITIVIPCFNEETWIGRTILSCIDQDYPPDKLNIIIVDDGSTDRSVEKIQETVTQLWRESERFHTKERIQVFLQKTNQGKREGMALGIRNCKTELVGFVDSDSFLEPDAVRCLVQPFYDPKVAGTTGRTDVVNAYTNGVTKMQSVRYYISFRIFKAAESYFDSVMCLSGPLSAYRLSVVNEVLDEWVNQTFLGQKATFGDDRSLTNFVVKNHRTYYQDTAICSTLVPNTHKVFLKQQMRWKRSWLRESLKAGKFMWRKEPLMSFSFYVGLLIPLVAPIIVLYNVAYVPIVQHVFPTTFLLGLLAMALLMSFAQLLLKKSSLWIYGLFFCVYYEAILLWQMPWAWVTFWVSSWGTRGGSSKKKKDKKDKGNQQGQSASPEALPSH
ncbi:MAG: glycosyltransferase [Eubacteriales bacterium]|nr:glycosyltransferase [Eubacteriales bacterium]